MNRLFKIDISVNGVPVTFYINHTNQELLKGELSIMFSNNVAVESITEEESGVVYSSRIRAIKDLKTVGVSPVWGIDHHKAIAANNTHNGVQITQSIMDFIKTISKAEWDAVS